MTTKFFLFCYCLLSTVILTFLFLKWLKLRKWYLILLINPESHVRVVRFFQEMSSVLKQFYPLLDSLICPRGRKPVDFKFQFRFLIWWKFFNRNPLNQAIRELNSSNFLKQVLNSPIDQYSREIFHTFRKKLGDGKLESMQTNFIKEFYKNKILDLKTIVLDSFPVKSMLNTQKCLKRPKIDKIILRNFIIALNLDNVLKKLGVSIKMSNKVKTKLIALLVKELWDMTSWSQCWRKLFDHKRKKSNYASLHYYSTPDSLKNIETLLKNQKNRHSIEKMLIGETCRVLNLLNIQKKNWVPQALSDLNRFWYTPHRLKDPGISFFHCSSKNNHYYGRGGLLAISESFELPLFVNLTAKYKQSEESILNFLNKFQTKFNYKLKAVKILGDSEFGTGKILEYIKNKMNCIARIPSYGTSKTSIKLTNDEKTDRKTIERVIARLVNNWNLERPSHLGKSFAKFHLQLAVFCDLLQVKFNLKIGNLVHPHAIKEIRG